MEITTAPFSARRTVYGFIDRQNLPGLFRTFDFASPDTSTPQRHTTTVPQQALFLMNSPFVVEQAKAPGRPARRDGADGDRASASAPVPAALRPGRRRGGGGAGPALSSSRRRSEKLLSPWEKYCQVLLLANEFVFVD